MAPHLYIDVHVLQTVPPSNLNRDDFGSPKQAIYGGARRARVSSQAWKRATRRMFVDRLDERSLATRTKRAPKLLANALSEKSGLEPDVASRISTCLFDRFSVDEKKMQTSYLLFVGREQLERILELVMERVEELAAMDDKTLKEELAPIVARELAVGHPIDVALFGRMVADIPSINVDAAVQVAHALSTHAVETEFDYYTAVDDENERDETGAGMIGTVEFNSATLYRFASLGVHQLLENLDGEEEATLSALATFLESFVRSMPTGHQTSFAHRTVPHLASVVLREDQPVNLVSGFERPVFASEADGRVPTGIASRSAACLAAEMLRVSRTWNLEPLAVATAFEQSEDSPALEEAFGPALSFGEVVDSTVGAARAWLQAQVSR